MANLVQAQLALPVQAPLNPAVLVGNNANAVAPNPPVVPVPGADIFLKQRDVETELNAQAEKVRHKYEIIAIYCGVVLAVAVVAIILGLGISAMLHIPMVYDPSLGRSFVASGYELEFVGLLSSVMIFGPIGAILLGEGMYAIVEAIGDYKANNLNALIEKSNKEFKGDEDRISEIHIHKILEKADEEAMSKLINKMDFKQLQETYKFIGLSKLRKFLDEETISKLINKMDFNELQETYKFIGPCKLHKLLSGMGVPMLPQHNAWKDIFSLSDSSNSSDIISEKIKNLHQSQYSSSNSIFELIVLEHLRQQQDHNLRFLGVTIWSKCIFKAQQQEKLREEKLGEEQQREEKILGEKRPPADPQVNKDEMVKVNKDEMVTLILESKPNPGQGIVREEIVVSRAILEHYSDVFTEALSPAAGEPDLKDPKKLTTVKELTLTEVADIDAFKNTVLLLKSPDVQNLNLSQDMLRRILQSSQEYFSRFSDKLQLVLPDDEVEKYLHKKSILFPRNSPLMSEKI